MKILIDLQSCQNGSKSRGIGRYSINVAKELIRLGNNHEFIVLLSDKFPESIDYVRKELDNYIDQQSIIVCSFPDDTSSADPNNYWRNHAAENLYRSFVEKLAIEVVFIPSLFEGFWDNTVVGIDPSAYRSVVTLHDLIPLEEPERYIPAQRDRDAYLRRINDVKQADLIVAISSFVADEARRRIAVEEKRLAVALNGIDDTFHVPGGGKEARTELMSRLGIARPFIFNSSPLEHRKNLEGLIAAFGALSIEIRNQYQLVIAGKFDDYAKKYLSGLARAEGLLEDSLVLPGFVSDNDLIALYGECSLFVFPSWSEGFGLPIIEAMACGAPVIAANTTSLPEVMGRDDLLVDPTSTFLMANAIEKILTDPDFQLEVREYGISRAKQFKWEYTAKSILKNIDEKILKNNKEIVYDYSNSYRPKLAIVGIDINSSSNISGRINGLIANISRKFDITLIGPSGFDVDQNISSLIEVRDIGWFDWNASRFDHIFYVGNGNSPRDLIDLMESYKGVFIEINPITPHPVYIDNGNLPDSLLVDLYKTRGISGLIESKYEQHNPDYLFSAFGEAYRRSSSSTLAEGVGNLPYLPISADIKVANTYKHKMGVPNESIVFIAIVSTKDAANKFINSYRRSIEKIPSAHIVIHIINEDINNNQPLHMDNGIRSFFGPLEEYYRGVMSCVNFLLLGKNLPEELLSRIENDANSLGIPFYNEDDTMNGAEKAIITYANSSLGKKPKHTSLMVPPCQEAINAWSDAISNIVKVSNKNDKSLLQIFERKLRRSIRGQLPTSLDVAKLAVALEKNSNQFRENFFAFDISSFASPNSVRRLDERQRHQLYTLLRAFGKRALPIYDAGGYFVVANQFIAKELKISTEFVHDFIFNVKSGDCIIGLDDFGSFSERSFSALSDVQKRGARLFYVSSAGTSRLETAGMLAEVLMIWMASQKHTWQVTLSGSDNETHSAVISASVKKFLDISEKFNLKFSILDLSLPSKNSIPLPSGTKWNVLSAEAEMAAKRLRDRVAEAMQDDSHLHYSVVGHLLGSYSLAIINRSVAATLEDDFTGRVHFRPYESEPIYHTEGVPKEEQSLMIDLCERSLPSPEQEITISQHWPILKPSWAPRLAFSLFPWEETHVPKGIVDTLIDGFDAIIAPTKFVSDALSISGCNLPVANIGQPVELKKFWDISNQRQSSRPIRNFLHISSCFPRKGVDVLLRAWSEAFTIHDNVELIIKTFPNPHNDVEEKLEIIRYNNPEMAPVKIINKDVDPVDILDLYKNADVMVLPSRGEGYNLPALEAMASGLPLIVTGQGGQRDFCSPSQARLLKYRYARSSSHVQGSHSMWLEPEVDDLILALREMIDPSQRDEIEKRRLNALEISYLEGDKNAWISRLKNITQDLLKYNKNESPVVGWVSTWGIRCGIAQYSSYLLDRMSKSQRDNLIVICDRRTSDSFDKKTVNELKYTPSWNFIGEKAREIVDEALKRNLEALVIQHQDGLISWEQLGKIGHDERLEKIVSVVVLHNARNLRRAGQEEINMVIQGLSKMSRVIVHNIDDMNFLLSLGLNKNLGLFPHGAFSPRNTPWPRSIGPSDSPVIGCHGFFFKHKGIDKLIRAAAILKRQWPGLKLRLVNARFPGEEHDKTISEAQNLAKDLGIEDSIEWYLDFLPVEKIESLLEGCDVITLPYDESDDSASGAVRTSLATMVPLVATRVQIFSELEGAVAWADNNTPPELARVISELIKNTSMRREIQSGMYEWLRAHDWNLLAERFENMITGLVHRKRLGWEDTRNTLL